MKAFYFLFVCLFSVSVLAKNKVVFTVPNSDPKKPDDLYVLLDYKKGSFSKKLIDSQVGASYASTEEFIVYLKEGTLILIKEFDFLNKNTIARNAISFKIKNGNLYYETNPGTTSTLWVITDFKNLKPIEIIQGHTSYGIDQ